MNVLFIGSSDLVGSRFNGYAARDALCDKNINSQHLVWNTKDTTGVAQPMFDIPGLRFAMRALARIEQQMSIHSMLQLQSFALPAYRTFRNADVVHYQIVHDGYFSILALPWLTSLKPSVWTWHDPWFMTGHCIYPLGCTRWEIGCGHCPALDLPFAFKRDRTAFGFRCKKWVCSGANVDIIVASKYMRAMAERSPIAKSLRLHHIPFGIDLERFRPQASAAARERLGIFENRAVLCVRATLNNPYKGLDYFIEAIARLPEDVHLSIITTHRKGCLDRFIGRHQIIELGWVDDEGFLADAYAASDVFVMPSMAEAFGMMAIEAMACGKPVIVFDGTSLPEVTFAPSAGLAVPWGNASALSAAILHLVNNPDERMVRGERSRRLAEQNYDLKLHVTRLAALYESVISRRNKRTAAERFVT